MHSPLQPREVTPIMERANGLHQWWEGQKQWLPTLCLNLCAQKQQPVIRTQILDIWRTGVEGSTCRAPLSTTDENKSTKTWSAWGGKVADLSKKKGQEPVPQWAFIGFNSHRNTGCVCTHTRKAHQSLSGRNDQIIGNIKELWWLILSQGQIVKGP